MNLEMEVLVALAALAQMVRWWRVAQREHYIAGAVTRSQLRWLRDPYTSLAIAVAIILTWFSAWAGSVACVIGAILLPRRLSMKGRTSPLVWTWRLRRVAILSVLLTAVLNVVSTSAS